MQVGCPYRLRCPALLLPMADVCSAWRLSGRQCWTFMHAQVKPPLLPGPLTLQELGETLTALILAGLRALSALDNLFSAGKNRT